MPLKQQRPGDILLSEWESEGTRFVPRVARGSLTASAPGPGWWRLGLIGLGRSGDGGALFQVSQDVLWGHLLQ